jgi:predicted transcriptional regulator of viral defense system
MNQARQAVIKAFDQVSVLRPRDLDALRVPRAVFSDLVSEGILYRSGRGIYGLVEREITEHHSLVEVAKRIPHGVICLLSALTFHELTTQNPPSVWVALDRKARKPTVDYPPVRVVRFSGEALAAGVERHAIEGIEVPVTSLPKTIADCFKYRNKLGLDMALEALRDAWQQKRLNLDQLWHYAKICRVTNVLRPYLDMLL